MLSNTIRAVLAAIPPAAGALSAAAQVPSYTTFELQARSNIVDGYNLPALSSFNSRTPAINDDGTIAFSILTIGGGDGGLFVGSGGVGGPVYTAPFDHGVDDPCINDAGEVCFEVDDIISDGIFIHDIGAGANTLTVPPITFSTITGACANDAGQIGYRAGTFGGPQSWRSWDTGAESIYASETGNIAFLFTPDFNNANQIAGKVRLNTTAGSSPDEIRRYDGPGAFTTLVQDDDADPMSPFTGFDNSISLADDGRVAFIAGLTGGGRGVFLTDGTTTTTIATEADPLVSEIIFFPPTVNNNGLVVFRGEDAAGLDAIFAGDGTTLTRVIGRTDLLPTDLGTAQINQNDNSIAFGGALGLNNRGDIAFNAALTPEKNTQIEWGSGMFIAYADPADCPADVNDDGSASPADFTAWLGCFNDPGSAPFCDRADVNASGTIDPADFTAWLAAFNAGCD